MKHIKWLFLALACLFLMSTQTAIHASPIDKVRRERVKRQAGLMSALVMVAAAKAVFGGAYIAGSLLKGQRGGNNNNYLPPGKFHILILTSPINHIHLITVITSVTLNPLAGGLNAG